jgi:sulfur carrier protein
VRWRKSSQGSRFIDLPERRRVRSGLLRITLNGDPFELDQPLSIADLLARLAIDPRRVAVEHNLTILKRDAFPQIMVCEGDQVEIVNFVGGG